MAWVDYALYLVFGGVAFILLAFAANLIITAKTGKSSLLLSRIYYVAAIVTVLINLVRSVAVYNWGIWLANLLVLACVGVAFRRSERDAKSMEEQGRGPR
ncbi:hypothetical protein [uncultured Anaerotruncus sp.]|uniref:hypothetical protein n=1 Tax=uncultured Anaerotruncus sp. TaxID=905011 RepID=UPI00280B80F0|nr:hypothetical protein [uncultured Anaerotruncus sp.]